MKKVVILGMCLLFFMTLSQTNMNAQNNEESQTALLLIDIQYFYFPGARQPLFNPEEASLNAQKLLTHFRYTDQLVIHVRHNSTLASLSGTYAKVTDTKTFLQDFI